MTSPLKMLLVGLIFSSILSLTTVAQEKSELPLASAVLVEKFDDYSEKLRLEAELKIDSKRTEVSAILTRHLKERTKAGDLDGAVAIRTVLEKWNAEAFALSAENNQTSDTKWKNLILTGDDPLKNWSYQKDKKIAVEADTLKIMTLGESYTPIFQSAERGNAVLAMNIEVSYDATIEKEQQAGVGFLLLSKEGGKELGSISAVIQGPEASLLYGEIAGGKGKILELEKNRAGIGRPSEFQIAFVDGHFLVFSRKRKIHDFYEPRLKDAVVGTVILFGNNSQAEFKGIKSMTPDAEQTARLLSGKPIE